MPNDYIEYIPNFFSSEKGTLYFNLLYKEIPWVQKEIQLFGKLRMEPRLTAWLGDANAIYTYSGIRMNPLPWTQTLIEIKAKVEAQTKTAFNSVLANLYRNHRDSMGFHSDDEKELGKEPFIASVSFGATRRFVMKPRLSKKEDSRTYRLGSNSLLIMRGNTQSQWKHGIPKETKPCGPRINLTFRKIQMLRA